MAPRNPSTYMATPLLEAKLRMPTPRPNVVARPRLIYDLSPPLESKLTLVSAPAGFGKTTLLADWVGGEPSGETSWLSLDTGDNQLTTFWMYVIAALQKVDPEIGIDALALLNQPQPAETEVVLTALLNDLNDSPKRFRLVLDDYHLIEASDIQNAMSFFVDHIPETVRLIIATRADPPLRLARLRAQGELIEIRAGDLRFTPDEAAAYLNEVMGLHLAAVQVNELEERTEGWIAALQLAALSLRGRDDAADFIAGFAGTDRYVVDYLVEEVLRRQTETVREFLLQTSILSRLSGPLCDAVTGQDDGKETLESLDRANLFLIPLDDHRHWYRFHHLFGDVLRARLLAELPLEIAGLHLRASEWHQEFGDESEAFRHAIAGGNFERAADLVEMAIPSLRQSRQEATMRLWLDALPEELFEVRPMLAIGYVASRMAYGDQENVETRLRQAERWLSDTPSDSSPQPPRDMVVVDHEGFRRAPGTIAVYRTALAHAAGDTTAAIDHALRSLEVMAEDDHLERGSAAGFLGLAYWSQGDLTAAERWWSAAVSSLKEAGHVSDVMGCSIALGQIRMAQGRLDDAQLVYEQGLALASAHGIAEGRGTADMHVSISEILIQRNDVVGAREHLAVSQELGPQAALPQNAHRWRVAMALVMRAEGDLDGAVELLDAAERHYTSDYFPNVRPIAALRARVWIGQGHLERAASWARDRGLSPDEELSYLREFEHITLTRLLLAKDELGGVDDALRLLGRVLAIAEDGGRQETVIETQVLRALALSARGEAEASLDALEEAIHLAEPEGQLRVFLDDGKPLAPLFRRVAKERGSSSLLDRLLRALGDHSEAAEGVGLVDPLTERELQVLRLLTTDLSGPDIAHELYVSLNTLRTHTKSIYLKLGVNSRRTALRRAIELGILPPH